MALILKDRVKETTTVVGTGTATLLGAVAGYQSFAAIGNGNTCYYTIAAQTGSDWEVGIGTYTASGTTLSRDTVLSSSNGGALVNFSAGTKDVFVTQPSEKAVYTDATNIVNALGNGTSTIVFSQVNTTNLVANTVTLTAGTITTNATNNTDITNKLYVDTVAATGLTYHTAVQAATTQSLAAQTGGVVVYNNGANGVGATLTLTVALTTLDGYSLANTNRILVKDETNQTYNGIYTWATGGTVLTRATDADTYGTQPNQLSLNDYFYVQNGNVNKGSAWVVDAPTGVITFGTSNIAFAQFSSAQVYSAGTGLSLNNTTFSIANTAVSAGAYGDAGTVATFTVNAQGQLTAASNAAINASSITLGTLANARTTASAANGASTIVSRDANGSFAANVITAVDVNSTNVTATTGSFTNISGNGVALTAINASNITSGTIDNARTTGNTANSANTIVLRDASGNFGSNVISASLFSGDGSAINAINASNISSGTIANARTTASSSNGASTIVQRDSGGNFSANTITANIAGNGSALTNINASNITSGTIGNAFTTANSSNGASTIVLRDAGGAFAAGAITGSFFIGDGSNVTAINASSITTGTISNARTTASSANGASTIVARDAGGNFSANTITASAFSGNGATLTDINASNITSGTISNARTTASSSNGASTIVARDANGSFSANVGTFTSISGNGVALTAINASNITSGTIDNARTTASSSNGANTIVLRDSTGSFTANAGTFTSVSGNGVALTAINASNISSGTIANARTTGNTANSANTLVLRDANGNFASNEISGQEMIATNGLFVNNMTVSSSYSIPAGYSAVSVGPATVANGVSVTVPSGGRWVVL